MSVDDHLPPSPVGTRVEPAEAVPDAVRWFFRTVRTLRTYPIDNEMSRRALAELAPRLTGVLPLTLELEADRLQSEGTTLTDEKGLLPQVVGDLHRDGVRRLRLERELAEDELRRLLLALAKPLDSSDLSEDYVTRLWEAQLPHVRILAVDPYLDLETPAEVLEGKAQPSEVDELDQVVPETELKVPPPPDFAFKIEPDEEAQVAREVERAATSERWGEFVATLFEAATMPALEPRRVELTEIFEGYFFRLLRGLHLELAVKVLEQLRSPDQSAAASFFGPSLARIAQADRLDVLHEALASGACNPKDGVSLLVLLAPESAGAVCRFLEHADSERLHRLYADVLTRIGEPAASTVVERFRSGSGDARRTYARVMGALEAEIVVSTLLDALSEPDPVIRREIVRAVAAHKRGGAALLQLALGDPESETRIIALRGLEGASTKIDEETMLQRIRSREYRALPSEEKDLLFRVLGTVGKDSAVAELQTVLRHSWIPGRTRRDDWPRAAFALARLGTPAALELLEAASSSGHSELRSVCASALRTAKKGKQ